MYYTINMYSWTIATSNLAMLASRPLRRPLIMFSTLRFDFPPPFALRPRTRQHADTYSPDGAVEH